MATKTGSTPVNKKVLVEVLEQEIVDQVDEIQQLVSEHTDEDLGPGEAGDFIWRNGDTAEIVQAAKACARIEFCFALAKGLELDLSKSTYDLTEWRDCISPE